MLSTLINIWEVDLINLGDHLVGEKEEKNLAWQKKKRHLGKERRERKQFLKSFRFEFANGSKM